MTSREQFLAEMEQFVSDYGMSAKRFSQMAMNDGSFLFRIRRGGDTTLGTAQKVRKVMAGYRMKHL